MACHTPLFLISALFFGFLYKVETHTGKDSESRRKTQLIRDPRTTPLLIFGTFSGWFLWLPTCTLDYATNHFQTLTTYTLSWDWETHRQTLQEKMTHSLIQTGAVLFNRALSRLPWHLYPVKIRDDRNSLLPELWPDLEFRLLPGFSFGRALSTHSHFLSQPHETQARVLLSCCVAQTALNPEHPPALPCSPKCWGYRCVTMPGTAVLKLKKYTPKPCRGWTRGDNII